VLCVTAPRRTCSDNLAFLVREASHRKIGNRVEDDRPIHNAREPEVLRVWVAYIGHHEIDHEGFLDSAIDQGWRPPFCTKGGGDHEDAHQADHDAPVLLDDRVLLDEREFGERF
jgi:hypothetical protein